MSTFKEYVEICQNAIRLSPSDFSTASSTVDTDDFNLEIDNDTRNFITEFNRRVQVRHFLFN